MPKETPGVGFPLEITSDNAGYRLSELEETVRFNIKNIILTSPGERIMIPDFGVGIKTLLFEMSSFELLESARNKIVEQINIYASYITILELTITPIDDTSINIRMKYEIDFAQIVDSIDIDITNI
jgi:phage baseplate assembly protein W|tara:strand:- start:205 stop:582 length:378 start_codon:yes stop_codon:yes gene_type:complete